MRLRGFDACDSVMEISGDGGGDGMWEVMGGDEGYGSDGSGSVVWSDSS